MTVTNRLIATSSAAAKVNLLGLSRQQLEDFFTDLGEKRFRAQQVMKWMHHQGVVDFAAMSNLGKSLREKLETLAMLLRGAIDAEVKVGLKLNIKQKNLSKLLQSLPALRNPTVSNLSQSDWVAVETVIDEPVVRELIPQLKQLGAEGIIEYPLNKVVY